MVLLTPNILLQSRDSPQPPTQDKMPTRKRELKNLDNRGEAPKDAKRKRTIVSAGVGFVRDHFTWKAAQRNKEIINYVSTNINETHGLIVESMKTSHILGVAYDSLRKLEHKMKTASDFRVILSKAADIQDVGQQVFLMNGAFSYQSMRYKDLEFKRDNPGVPLNKSNEDDRNPIDMQNDMYRKHGQPVAMLGFDDQGDFDDSLMQVDTEKLDLEVYGDLHSKVQRNMEVLDDLLSNFDVIDVVHKMTLVGHNMASIANMLKAVQEKTKDAEAKMERLAMTYGLLPDISKVCMLSVYADDEDVFHGITKYKLSMFMGTVSVFARRFREPKKGEEDTRPMIIRFMEINEAAQLLKTYLLAVNKTRVLNEHGEQRRCVVQRLRGIARSCMTPLQRGVTVHDVVVV